MATNATDPFVTVSDAAAALGVSRSTVHQRVSEGKLKRKIVAGRVVIYRNSLERLLDEMAAEQRAA